MSVVDLTLPAPSCAAASSTRSTRSRSRAVSSTRSRSRGGDEEFDSRLLSSWQLDWGPIASSLQLLVRPQLLCGQRRQSRPFIEGACTRLTDAIGQHRVCFSYKA
mmetsp:Transcript_29516/g.51783  ORF Transcript_29516/g.51783 Transcript_29516/m.51783 type:complete len:105 (+) Transcript_29516:599-913(+)